MAVVVPVTSVEATGSEAMQAPSFSTLIIIIMVIFKCYLSRAHSPFVDKVSDQKTGKVSTSVNAWQYSRCIYI